MIERRDYSGLRPRARPPYVAFKTFEQFLERVHNEPIPVNVDASLLKRWGIAAGNESALITSLKALGLIDSDGQPTSDFEEIRLSPQRRLAALRRAAQRAYSDLDGAFDASIQDDQLYDYFVGKRGLRGQMVEKSIRFYRHLEQLLRAERLSNQPTSRASTVPRTETTVPFATVSGASARSAEALSVSLVVQLPFDADERQLAEFFGRVWRAWQAARGQ